MPRPVFTLLATALLAACGQMKTLPPVLSLAFTAKPGTITDDGIKAVLAVDASDDTGKPLTGTVTVTAEAGQLGKSGKDGRTSSLTLDDTGHATVDFTCVASSDANCKGNVRLEARWEAGDKFLVQVLRVAVTSTGDGGTP